MEYDYYKLYLAIDYVYQDIVICESLDQIEYELNKAVGYNKYMIIGHSNEHNMDVVVAMGDIELNRQRTRR